MSLQKILGKLSKQLGLTLILNDQELCHFKINDKYLITLENSLDGNSFFLYAPICQVPRESQESLLAKALEGNLFGLETGDASFGFDSSTRTLLLFQKFSRDIEYTVFYSAFETFLGYQSYWISKMGQEQTVEDFIKPSLGQQNLRVFIA